MATKSNNTIGNPYHADNGQFTSPDDNISSNKKISLKANVDLSNISQVLQNNNNSAVGLVDTKTPLTLPISVQDAEMQGNRILGSKNVVGYADDTDLKVAHSFNQGLQDVCRDFSKVFDNEQLYLYGTENKRIFGDKQQARQDEQKLIQDILSRPIYVQKLKDLGLDVSVIMDTMTYSLHKKKKDFGEDPEKGCGGFTSMTDYDDKKHVLNTYNVIKFNTHYSRDLQKWEKYPKIAIQNGHFLPIGDKNGAYMVAVHELGHHVFEKLVDLMSKDEKDTLRQLVDAKNINHLYKTKEISGYAMTSRHEHIAECFANVYCLGDKATTHNKKIFNFLKNVYKRIYD